VRASDGKRVAHHRPLRLAEEAEHLAEIVDQAGEHEPAGMPVAADRLGRLQKVLDLGQLGVGVAVVDQRVEKLHRLPDAHDAPCLRQELGLLGAHELDGLEPVIEPIELAHARASLGPIVAKRRVHHAQSG